MYFEIVDTVGDVEVIWCLQRGTIYIENERTSNYVENGKDD